MTLAALFSDQSIKAKAKVAQVGDWLLNGELPVEELLAFTETQTGTHKATGIEALEYATKKNPGLAEESLLSFITEALLEEEPRIKWESAKVIGNIARLFPGQLSRSIALLLVNSEHKGTVVRWATAYALAEILKLKTAQNKTLLAEVERLAEQEEDNAVQKKYLDALKKVKR